MKNTETIMHIVLDKQRNDIILFDLKANLMAVSIATGTFVSSLFGMNLVSSLESSVGLFYLVAGGSVGMSYVAYLTALKLLKSVRPGSLNGDIRQFLKYK
jgi:hypothetical protein